MLSRIDHAISDVLLEKERKLVQRIEELESVVVAYSGGVDSSLLAYYAKAILKNKARVVIAVSPSLAHEDLESARAQAMLFDWDLVEITTDEFSDENYQRNDDMRCYHCKTTLFEELKSLALDSGVENIVYGANLDDLKDFRPGRVAADQNNVIAPMEEAGLNKQEIRTLALRAGLPSWDRPQNACLSSRIPKDTRVTIDNISQVEAAERLVKALGFSVVRVRHHGDKAMVELGLEEMKRLKVEPYLVNKIETGLIDLGFFEVDIDPRGYRQGALHGHEQSERSRSLAQAVN